MGVEKSGFINSLSKFQREFILYGVVISGFYFNVKITLRGEKGDREEERRKCEREDGKTGGRAGRGGGAGRGAGRREAGEFTLYTYQFISPCVPPNMIIV